MSLIARIARALEEGRVPPWLPLRAAAGAWASVAARGVARPLRWPDGARVIAIGGATLGGSGKTPLAIAIALREAERGDVAIVGHAYRASPRAARWVSADDPVAIVGDEALVCARRVASSRARVVVAPKKQDALDFAARHGVSTFVLDGVAQTAPRRASRAILAVDADAPWGSRATPPIGDLRAPVEALVDACDEIVVVRDELAVLTARLNGEARRREVSEAFASSRGVWIDGAITSWEALRGVRVGLVTALARPARVLAFLARRGVVPAMLVSASDHAAPRLSKKKTEVWIATEKCAAHAPDLAPIDYRLALSPP